MDTPRNFALIAPMKNVSALIEYFAEHGQKCVDHFPSLEKLEGDHNVPFDKHDVVIVDSSVTTDEIDNAFLSGLKTVFGDCGVVVLRDGTSDLKIDGELSAEVVEADASLTTILEASLRAGKRC